MLLVAWSGVTQPLRGQASPEPLQTFDDASMGTVLAVGPTEIVTYQASDFVVRNRQGVEVLRDEYADWWQGIGAPWTDWYEGIVFHYDPVAQRWCAAAHEFSSGNVYIALSNTSSFVGSWSLFTFTDAFVKGEEAADLRYARYSDAHLGFGGGLVAYTLLLDDHDGRNVDWEEDDSGYVILALGDIKGGGNSPITARQFRVFHEELPYAEPWPVPARTLSDASGLYFLSLLDAQGALYGLSKLSMSGNGFLFSKNYFSFVRPSLASGGGYVIAEQPQTSVKLGHEDEFGDAREYGNQVDLIPIRRNIRDVVMRDGHLWAVHEGMDLANGSVRTHWLQLKLTNPKAFVQSGRIGGGDESMSCLAPSVAVNGAHDVMVGFTLTGPHHFPSAAYAVRMGGDDPGSMRGLRVYAAGNRNKPDDDVTGLPNFAFWPGRSHTMVDPFDDFGFWSTQALMLSSSSYQTVSVARVFGNIPPSITQQPANKTVPPQGSAVFSLVAAGTDLQYRWFHNDTELPGSVTATLTVSNVNALRTGYYRCRVRNAGGEVWSNDAVLALTTGNPGVFSFVDGVGNDLSSAGFNEKPPTFQGIPLPRNLTIRRRNGADGRVRVAVNLRGRFDPPALPATEGWDYQGIQTPPLNSRFFSGPGALVFEDGETQKLVPLNIRNDTLVEEGLPETLEATLSPDPLTGAATTTPKLAGTIIDDDFTPTFQGALDTSLVFTNENKRWKAQTSVTSDGVDAVQSDLTGPAEPSTFSTSLEGDGTLAFRWRVDGDAPDALRLLKRTAAGGEERAASISGRSAWKTVALAVTDPGRGTTGIDWQFIRGSRSRNLLATGYVDEVMFHQGTGGLVEFAQTDWSIDEGSASLTLTLRRLGHGTGSGNVMVSLVDGTAAAGVDFQPLASGLINFPGGVTIRTVTVTILPDETTEPPETLRAVLSPVGGSPIGIGPVAEATLTIADQPGETYATWAASRFTPAQLADPAISGPTADADGDGLINFLEYAFDGDPLAATSVPWPRSAVESVPDEDVLHHVVRFARRRQAADLTYVVQRSTDGITWQDGAKFSPTETISTPELVQLVSAVGSPIESRVVRDGAPVAPGGRAWLRLKLTSP
jgi:hypothetical protein